MLVMVPLMAWSADPQQSLLHALRLGPLAKLPAGALVVGATEDETLGLMQTGGHWGRNQIVAIPDMPFGKAYETQAVQAADAGPWGVQFHHAYQHPIRKGDVLFVHFYLRAVAVEGNRQQGTMDLNTGLGWRETLRPGPEWQRFMFALKANKSMEPGHKDARMTGFIAQHGQRLQLGGFLIVNLGQDVDAASAPHEGFPDMDLLRSGTEVTEPTPGRVTGARIDEGVIAVTIHVSPQGNDHADGTPGAPVQSFGRALTMARTHLINGEPTRILLHEGTYREGWSSGERSDWEIDGNRMGGQAEDTLLVIEAAPEAQVIFDGSDLFPIADWEQAGITAGGAPIYRRALPIDLGWDSRHFHDWNPNHPVAYRKEMMFINDRPLRQLMLEQYPEVPRTRAARGPYGDNDPYGGPLSPTATLEPGTFGVTVHPSVASYVYFCPPPDVSLESANIALSTKHLLFRILNKNNNVLRGITFRRYGANLNSSPFFFIGSRQLWRNLLIENCRFDWNNGTGLRYQWIEGLTLRNNTFNYNSFRGEGGIVVRNVLKENNEANFNNWRGYWGDYTGWSVAGSKSIHVRDQVVRDYRLIGNLAFGYWLDINCQNNNFEGIFAAYNRRAGWYYEICDGPALLEHSILAFNESGALVQCSDQIWLRNNIFIDNVQNVRMVHERDRGRPLPGTNTQDDLVGTRTYPRRGAALGRVQMRDNLNVITSPNRQLLTVRFDGADRRHTFLHEWLVSDGNLYAGPVDAAYFGAMDPPHRRGQPQRAEQMSFAQWQQSLGQDASGRLVSLDQMGGSERIPSYEQFADRSPYLQRGLTPAIMAELKAFLTFVGIDYDEYRGRSIFEDVFEAEELHFK